MVDWPIQAVNEMLKRDMERVAKKIGISGVVKKRNKKGEIEDIELTGVSLNKKIEPNFFGSSNNNITTKEK